MYLCAVIYGRYTPPALSPPNSPPARSGRLFLYGGFFFAPLIVSLFFGKITLCINLKRLFFSQIINNNGLKTHKIGAYCCKSVFCVYSKTSVLFIYTCTVGHHPGAVAWPGSRRVSPGRHRGAVSIFQAVARLLRSIREGVAIPFLKAGHSGHFAPAVREAVRVSPHARARVLCRVSAAKSLF